MLDAVETGNYGVMGLYAAQPVAVPDPPPAPRGIEATETPAVAVPSAQAAEVGNAPVTAAEPDQAGAETGGRRYADEGQAGARQAAVAASLSANAASPAGAGGETGSAFAGGSPAASTGRALRAYARSGGLSGAASSGAMLSSRV